MELLLSNQRMSFKGSHGWHEMPFASLRAVNCEVDALAVHIVDARPLRISVDAPESVFILLNHVAWHRLRETHLPEEVIQRMQGSETIVFADGRRVAIETLRVEDAGMRDGPGSKRALDRFERLRRAGILELGPGGYRGTHVALYSTYTRPELPALVSVTANYSGRSNAIDPGQPLTTVPDYAPQLTAILADDNDPQWCT